MRGMFCFPRSLFLCYWHPTLTTLTLQTVCTMSSREPLSKLYCVKSGTLSGSRILFSIVTVMLLASNANNFNWSNRLYLVRSGTLCLNYLYCVKDLVWVAGFVFLCHCYVITILGGMFSTVTVLILLPSITNTFNRPNCL